MKFEKFSEIKENKENTSEDINESMMEESKKIERLLGTSEIDQKWIKENETKEFKPSITSSLISEDENINQEYLREIKKIAVELNTSIKYFSYNGLNITTENILKDIENEIKEFKFASIFNQANVDENIIQEYLREIRRFVIKINLLIENNSYIGLKNARENILKDIENEIIKQQKNEDKNEDKNQITINWLRQHLDNIFGDFTTPSEEQKESSRKI